MLLISLAVLALGASPLQDPPTQRQEPPATTLPPVTSVAPETEPTTRRVCRFETALGSNRRVRVCRDVPRQGVQDQATRDYMRDNQRVRMPDGG
jgi:hypothetical protein